MHYPDLVDFDECTYTEAGALGAMMLNTEALEYGIDKLRPRMLSSAWNRRVLVAIARLNKQAKTSNLVITPIETSIEMRKMGWPSDKAFQYCMHCTDYCPCPANFKYLIDEVASTARRRSICAVGEWLRLGEWASFHARKPEADDKRVAATIANCLELIQRDGWCDPERVWERTK